MNKLQDVLRFQNEIHKNALEKGFWEGENKGEKVMLMISELGELVEAHRKDRRSIDTEILYWKTYQPIVWKTEFEYYVKDTIEDEIADAAIRVIDYCKRFNITLNEIEGTFKSSENFASDVLNLCQKIFAAYYINNSFFWNDVINEIISLCDYYEIDLVKHIEWKLQYNKLRPYKHNKAY